MKRIFALQLILFSQNAEIFRIVRGLPQTCFPNEKTISGGYFTEGKKRRFSRVDREAVLKKLVGKKLNDLDLRAPQGGQMEKLDSLVMRPWLSFDISPTNVVWAPTLAYPAQAYPDPQAQRGFQSRERSVKIHKHAQYPSAVTLYAELETDCAQPVVEKELFKTFARELDLSSQPLPVVGYISSFGADTMVHDYCGAPKAFARASTQFVRMHPILIGPLELCRKVAAQADVDVAELKSNPAAPMGILYSGRIRKGDAEKLLLNPELFIQKADFVRPEQEGAYKLSDGSTLMTPRLQQSWKSRGLLPDIGEREWYPIFTPDVCRELGLDMEDVVVLPLSENKPARLEEEARKLPDSISFRERLQTAYENANFSPALVKFIKEKYLKI